MNLEAHPALHYSFILAFYNLGLAINVLAAAYLAAQSQLNNIQGIAHYFQVRWVPVGIRWILCIFLFLVAWGNPSVIPLERFMPNFAAHLGVAGMLGWASDSVFDKVLAIVMPGIQHALPAVPNDPNPTPNH